MRIILGKRLDLLASEKSFEKIRIVQPYKKTGRSIQIIDNPATGMYTFNR